MGRKHNNSSKKVFWNINDKDWLDIASAISAIFLPLIGTGWVIHTYFSDQDKESQRKLDSYFTSLQSLENDIIKYSREGDKVKREETETIQSLAIAKTLITLQSLDPARKSLVIQYLHDSGLMPVNLTNYISSDKILHISCKAKPISNFVIPQRQILIYPDNPRGGENRSLNEIDVPANTSLAGINFNKISLDKINFEGANLDCSSFQGGVLNNVNFNNTRLTGVNFSQATLTNVDFTEALLSCADFGAGFFTNFNCSSFHLSSFHLTNNINFKNIRLNGANFPYTMLRNVNFTEASLSDAHLRADFDADSNNTVIDEGVDFNHAILIDTNLTPEQIKSACNWENAYYKGSMEKEVDNKDNQENQENQENQDYIDMLKKDKKSDPEKTNSCIWQHIRAFFHNLRFIALPDRIKYSRTIAPKP